MLQQLYDPENGFQGDKIIFLRNFGALVLALAQLYVFFWFANEVILESLAISDVIYNESNWITYSKANKMLLVMVLQRSHRNFALKAAAIGEMSISTFTKILRLCYSITTFFMTAYDLKGEEAM
ncbi:unnamed protein product [Acanthoscelides obtectus]|uniref:Uncharacterized protein n=1 Tax=Acanthoscelides obtectus TaxID=200917 RepID=A0A9P0PKQ2_ACAOB|nr:unnamed protein product [Acanthoscelides obtectus]CAK1638313.1 Odorant receptor Or2 [Acanthoscelides obtectus]